MNAHTVLAITTASFYQSLLLLWCDRSNRQRRNRASSTKERDGGYLIVGVKRATVGLDALAVDLEILPITAMILRGSDLSSHHASRHVKDNFVVDLEEIPQAVESNVAVREQALNLDGGNINTLLNSSKNDVDHTFSATLP